MLFNSPVYLFIFLPFVVLVYFLLSQKRQVRAAKAWLVLASLFFYGYWNPVYLLLITSSMFVNFVLGRALHRSQGQTDNTNAARNRRKLTLTVGVVFNLGLLGYFKYADFFVENYNLVFGTGLALPGLVLPLAISFFTFQQIAYLVDSYTEDTQEYDLLNYCLFVTFFPQLIAGPIVHHREMMPQFMRLKNSLVDWRNIASGLFVFSLGLFKKTVIADTFAVWANAGFDTDQPLRFFEAWGASLSYSFQLYYDFSGYSDMAIGAALLLNIRLPVNFNSPYKALDIRDFWQRWHMTLSRWLRDYVYIPLGGNRSGRVNGYVNVAVTFLLGGLWHGAGWTFVAWGAMHGGALVVYRLWHDLGLRMPALLAWASTFLFVNTTWVFFRAETFPDALRVLKGMVDFGTAEIPREVTDVLGFSSVMDFIILSFRSELFQTAVGMQAYLWVFGLIAFLAPNTVQMVRLVPYRGRLVFRPGWKSAVATGAIIFLAILTFTGNARPSEFLYFNF